MPSTASAPAPRPPASFGGHATEHLRVIRSAMERSATFTAVPGKGGVAMGCVGLAAMVAAFPQPAGDRWLLVWLLAAFTASAVGLVAMASKARRTGSTLTGANARRFALAVAAPIVAGASLTYALWSSGTYDAMPAAWLLLYGTAVLTGGAYSVPVIRMTGALFMLLGIVATLTPPGWHNVWLGAGFGLLHIGSGFYVTRHHGG